MIARGGGEAPERAFFPTVEKLLGGSLAVVCYSVLQHLGSIGRTLFTTSSDGGKTWTDPRAIVGTSADDRHRGRQARGSPPGPPAVRKPDGGRDMPYPSTAELHHSDRNPAGLFTVYYDATFANPASTVIAGTWWQLDLN